jgi:hypothetical protein
VTGINETLFAGALDKIHKVVEIARQVGDDDRLLMGIGLGGRPDLEEFFKGADATGQNQKDIRSRHHLNLALDHGLYNEELGEALQRGLGLREVSRNNPRHGRPALQGCARHDAHQAGAARTKDQRPAALPNGLANL